MPKRKLVLDYTGEASARSREGGDDNVYLDHEELAGLIVEELPIDSWGWWHGRLHILVELVEEGE